MTSYPWPVLPLNKLAEVRLGRQRSPKNHSGPQMRLYLRAANVGWNGLILDDVKEMNFTDDEMSTYALRPGDLLLGEASGSPGEVGKPALWKGELAECAFQNTLLRVRSETMEPEFLLHFFRHQALRGRFVEESRGVGIHHLGRERLAKWLTPQPPLGEQRRIVAILEEHLSDLDSGLVDLDSSRARLRSLRLRTLENMAPAGAPMQSLGSVALGSGYGTSAKCVAGGAGPAVVRIPNLVRGRVNLNDEKRAQDGRVDLSSYMLQAGDLLIVRTNGSKDLIGRSAVVQEGVSAAFASYLIRFRLDESRVQPEWARLMLERPGTRAELESLAASSAGQHNLSLGKLNPLQIPVPSLSAQAALMAAWAEQAALTDRLGEAIDDTARRAKSLHRAILTAAFSGRLTGHGSDTDVLAGLAEQETA